MAALPAPHGDTDHTPSGERIEHVRGARLELPGQRIRMICASGGKSCRREQTLSMR